MVSVRISQSLPAGFVLQAKTRLLLTAGLETDHPGQPPSKLTPRLPARIPAATRRKPADGSTHRSCRKLAARLGVGKDLDHRVWREAGLKPHRLKRHIASNDPDFKRKAVDIIGPYLDRSSTPPFFSIDDKTAIQALDRRDHILPSSPGRAEREVHIICDNLSAHKTKLVDAFLDQHPTFGCTSRPLISLSSTKSSFGSRS